MEGYRQEEGIELCVEKGCNQQDKLKVNNVLNGRLWLLLLVFLLIRPYVHTSIHVQSIGRNIFFFHMFDECTWEKDYAEGFFKHHPVYVIVFLMMNDKSGQCTYST